MPDYVFSVNRIEVHNCRSKGDHNDSDWITMFVKINNSVQPPVGPINIGTNIHAGDTFTGPWWIGPVEISDADNVSVAIIVTNHSHLSDINEQRAEAIKVESAALGAIIGIVGGPIGAAIGVAMAGLGEVLGWIVGKTNPNCNGEVLTATFEYPPGMLARQGTPQIVSNEYTAISPSECGNSPRTTITFAVINPFSLRQFLTTHRLQPNPGLRSIMAPAVSLRSFEGMMLTFPQVNPDRP